MRGGCSVCASMREAESQLRDAASTELHFLNLNLVRILILVPDSAEDYESEYDYDYEK
jgi:hypothetical protein